MVEWRDPVEEDIDRNLECVSRITGASGNGHVPALHIHEVQTPSKDPFGPVATIAEKKETRGLPNIQRVI